MIKGSDSVKIPFMIGSGYLLLLVIIELLSILHLNNGLFVYTLDDPYIHLSLAQHIMRGHYGINTIEYSAPSSTILWPFIIAPFSAFIYFPFLLNVAASLATIFLFTKILNASFDIKDKRTKNILVTVLLILLIFASNQVGLIFTGMEHSLQVLVVSIIVYGLIIVYRNNKVKPWLLIAIVAAPLIRYENLAVSVAACVYLLLNGYRKKTIIIFLLIVTLVGGFSIFLISMGLNPLPTSVFIKSYFVESGGSLRSLLSNFAFTLRYRQGIILVIGLILTLIFMLKVQNPGKKKLAFICCLALVMHFMAGRYDWFNRYEIYIWTFFLLIIIFLVGSNISGFIEYKYTDLRFIGVLLFVIIASVCLSWIYITGLFDIPLASNNIYEQQYQMHRFVREYYR
ncbi:MAG TPA: hypothetical protein VLB50_08415, partial [Ignavibacteriaceae bacterium]|nr:hypothetical protein [Ignavibacteriaceae bacterium]